MATSSHGPLVQIAAPPGTGKSTVLTEMVALAEGEVVVDIDEILTDGALLGVLIATAEAAPLWPAYDGLWLRFAEFVRRAGHPVVMFVQVPDAAQIAALTERSGSLLGWEVADSVRQARLTERGWTTEAIAGADQDAALLRSQLPTDRLIHSPAQETPAESAVRLWAGVRAVLRTATAGPDRSRG